MVRPVLVVGLGTGSLAPSYRGRGCVSLFKGLFVQWFGVTRASIPPVPFFLFFSSFFFSIIVPQWNR